MKRRQFLRELKEELKKRTDIETEEVLFYYDEMIQDAIDNGESEDIFIMNLGSVRDIVRRIEDDEAFLAEVKSKNSDAVRNVLSTTVKIIGYFIFAVLAFSLAVTCFSVFVSGIAVVIAAIVQGVISTPVDIMGYLFLAGIVLIGFSLIIVSVGVVKWFFNQANPALLSIFRKLKELINRKGK
ncbi:DUF1700 domain-containing protein [Candidatus Izemoplasma sp. B36]|uniref:DUF1700 domain-containing protein n=1 Tax=Candidatus Izemoplasma sp. B36 TaxID=3242468 RepID=UPI003556A5F5